MKKSNAECFKLACKRMASAGLSASEAIVGFCRASEKIEDSLPKTSETPKSLINEFIKKECIVDNAKMVSCLGIYNRFLNFRKERNLEPVTIRRFSNELLINSPNVKKQKVRMPNCKKRVNCYFGLDLIYK